MGLSRNTLKRALKRSLEMRCYFPGSLSEAMEMVVDCEEESSDDNTTPLLENSRSFFPSFINEPTLVEQVCNY